MYLIKTEAVVLKSDNYRSSSKIVTLYSKSHGKVRGIAKGVRDVRNKMGCSLQPMSHLIVNFYFKENRTLHLISKAEHLEIFKNLHEDSEKMKIGFRILELLNQVTIEHHENAKLYSLAVKTFCCLNDATKNYINVFFNFEFQLMKLLGFGLNFDSEPQRFNGNSEFLVRDAGKGRFLQNVGVLSSNEVGLLKIISKGNFIDIIELNISSASESTIDNFFASYIQEHFGYLSYSKVMKVIVSTTCQAKWQA